MLSRTIQASCLKASFGASHLPQSASVPSTVRLISSTKETVGGTKTDHREELKHKSQSQKAERHTQNSQDTSRQGGSQGGAAKAADPKAEGKTGSDVHQEPHIGSMNQG
ncbi:hypothetical protein TruAng_004811 [Truncatella angustata]|nr:hypothetical protein TruAng_004811 [Truncatella angustata]